MNIILFFTYGISLKDWENSGLLDREIEFYREQNKINNISFTFVTYGDDKDLEVLSIPYIRVIPIYGLIKKNKNKFYRMLKSFYVPFILSKEIRNSNILKTNQLNGSWVALISKFLYKKPLIVRTGYDLYEFSKMNKKSLVVLTFHYILTRISLFYSNIYLVTSKVDLNRLKEISMKHTNKVVLRPNWVKVNITKDFSERYTNKIISVGRLEKQKDYGFLIEGLKKTNYQVDIFGEGTLKNELMSLSKANSLELQINKPVSNKALLKVLNNYKVFISTSKFEGNPKAILEAMGSGCIVVARKSENIKEIISHNVNGFLINDENELRKIVNKIMKDEIDYEKISKNAIDFVLNHNSLDKFIMDEFKEYEKLNSS